MYLDICTAFHEQQISYAGIMAGTIPGTGGTIPENVMLHHHHTMEDEELGEGNFTAVTSFH